MTPNHPFGFAGFGRLVALEDAEVDFVLFWDTDAMGGSFSAVFRVMFQFPPFVFLPGHDVPHLPVPECLLGTLADFFVDLSDVGCAQEQVPVVVTVHVEGQEDVGRAVVALSGFFASGVIELFDSEVTACCRVHGLGFIQNDQSADR